MHVREWLDHTGVRHGYDSLGVGVAVHAVDGALVYVNRAGLELLGVPAVSEVPLTEQIARFNFQGPAGQPWTTAELPVARVLAGLDAADTELSVHLPTGVRRQLRANCRRVADERGALVAIVQTFFDYAEAASALGAVRDLVEQSTPVLNVGNKLLLQPLIGTLDSARAAQAMEKLLETIGLTGSRVAIVDITGVSAVDTATANHLLRSLTAARLLGCEVVLSGVSPPIARTITLLGLDLSALRTKRDVAAALEFGRRWVEATEPLAARDSTGAGADDATEISAPQKPTGGGAA